jgi:hypothetical protein
MSAHDELLKRFKAHRDMYAKTGDRISFGRMEGMMDAADLAEDAPLVEAYREALRERHKDLLAETG